MSQVKGEVGKRKVIWKEAPSGTMGCSTAIIDGEELEVRWRKDRTGIWIELPDGVYGYEFVRQPNDEGRKLFALVEREGAGEWSELSFLRAGEALVNASGAGKRKTLKIKAQMPGKIIKILVNAGDDVSKDQPLLLMEAMKMENEIRAPANSTVKEVSVQPGQAVETGAPLLILE